MALVNVHKGPTPPADKGALWLDTSLWGSRIDNSPNTKSTPLASLRSRYSYLGPWHQEPNPYYSQRYDYWGCLFSNSTPSASIALAQAYEPTSKAADAWWAPSALITDFGAYTWHATCHNIDEVLYWFGGNNSGTVRLFTADVPPFGSTPVWTDRGNVLTGVTSPGNPGVCRLPDGTWVLYMESLRGGQWRTGVYTAPAATGPYTQLELALEVLSQQTGVFGYGGPYPVVENDGITLLFHTSMARKSVGMKARMRFPGLGAGRNLSDYLIDGTIADPWIDRSHPSEVDQTCDLSAAFDAQGHGFAFWAGNTNAGDANGSALAGVGNVMMAPVQPTLRIWVGNSWQPAHAPAAQHLRREWSESRVISNADYTINNGELVVFQNFTANHTVTLPRAGLGSRLRLVTGLNNNGTQWTLTPAVISGNNAVTGSPDVFAGAAGDPMGAWATRTLVCHIDGTWMVE